MIDAKEFFDQSPVFGMSEKEWLKVSEKRFQSWVLRIAKNNGWTSYHTWNSMHSAKGYPDLHMLRGTRQVFAELKREKGKTTESQDDWINKLQKIKTNEVYLWRPSDWREIEETLNGKRKKKEI